jgi:hypothetical protein
MEGVYNLELDHCQSLIKIEYSTVYPSLILMTPIVGSHTLKTGYLVGSATIFKLQCHSLSRKNTFNGLYQPPLTELFIDSEKDYHFLVLTEY